MGVSLLNRGLLLKVASPLTFLSGLLGLYPRGEEHKIIVNYNGQADLLLSLQIPPDYYPYQFKKFRPSGYLTSVGSHLVANEKTSPEKKKLAERLQSRIGGLLSKVREFGPGLWDRSMYNEGLELRNDQFWSSKKTDLLFLEQFIVDEHRDITDAYEFLPTHKKLLITNHRAARDPFTIFSPKVFKCLSGETDCPEEDGRISGGMRRYLEEYERVNVDAIYRAGRYIDFWNSMAEKNRASGNRLELDEWVKGDGLFHLEKDLDGELSKEFLDLVFTEGEKKKIKGWSSDWTPHYLKKAHHPVLEQQRMPGEAPVAEGSQKDPMVFLFQFALLLDEFSKTKEFKELFINDFRKEAMANALANALEMSENFRERIGNIRDYFKKIDVVDERFDPENKSYENGNSKTFAMVAFPPKSSGGGGAAVNGMSQYPFIYGDIGLRQPVPNFLSRHEEDIDHNHGGMEMFSVNDNGWWWRLGDFAADPTNLLEFRGTSDDVLVLADAEGRNLLKSDSLRISEALGSMLRGQREQNGEIGGEKSDPIGWAEYDLWSEGLKSPLALNLILDELVEMFRRRYDGGFRAEGEYSKAMDWGGYWSGSFLGGAGK